jgi:hypothetical protein
LEGQTIRAVIPQGAHVIDYTFYDEEDVKDWLYARYLNPEGR